MHTCNNVLQTLTVAAVARGLVDFVDLWTCGALCQADLGLECALLDVGGRRGSDTAYR